jgi:hypothetical protein
MDSAINTCIDPKIYDCYELPTHVSNKNVYVNPDYYKLEKKYSFKNQSDLYTRTWRKYIEKTVVVLTSSMCETPCDLTINNNYYRKGYNFRFRYTFIDCKIERTFNQCIFPIQFMDIGNIYFFQDGIYNDFQLPLSQGHYVGSVIVHPQTWVCEIHGNINKMDKNLQKNFVILIKNIQMLQEIHKNNEKSELNNVILNKEVING